MLGAIRCLPMSFTKPSSIAPKAASPGILKWPLSTLRMTGILKSLDLFLREVEKEHENKVVKINFNNYETKNGGERCYIVFS